MGRVRTAVAAALVICAAGGWTFVHPEDAGKRRAARLQVSKTVSPDPMIIGAESVYTVTVTNTGDQDAEGVTVTDTLDANVTVGTLPAGCSGGQVVTCDAGTLGPGESTAFRIPVTVKSNISDGTNITNRATASSTTPGVADDSTQLISQTMTSTDVEIKKSGPASVDANGTIRYTVVVTNHGPSDAVDVTVQDPTDGNKTTIVSLPGECPASGLTITCPLGTLTPGESVTLVIELKVKDGFAGTITNCATVYTGSRESDTGNNESCTDTNVGPSPNTDETNVTVVKQGPATVHPDGTITYTVVVTGAGPKDAENVVVRDPDNPNVDIVRLPDECTDDGTEVVCDLGTLDAGQVVRLNITVHVHDDVEAGTVLRNCAEESTSTAETNHDDDASCVRTVVEKEVPPTPPEPSPPAPSPPVPSPPAPTDSPEPPDGPSPSPSPQPAPSGSAGSGPGGSGPAGAMGQGGLPYTGAAIGTFALAAVALLVTGLVLRRSARRR